MIRKEEIVYAAKAHEHSTQFGELVRSKASRGVNSAYGIGFLEGAEWADETMMIKVKGWIKERAHDYMWDFGYESEKAIEDLMKYVEGGI